MGSRSAAGAVGGTAGWRGATGASRSYGDPRGGRGSDSPLFGQNAIARVDPATKAVKLFPLPAEAPYANLNTASFDKTGTLWFTGQAGYHGRVDPASGKVEAWKSPRGFGTYGITTTPAGDGRNRSASVAR